MNFKVGDRIITHKGTTGKICHIYNDDDDSIGVHHDKEMKGHDCNGFCPNKFGWYYYRFQIKKIEGQLELDF